ncbi:hypothetical protein SH1V18_40700 [Vallitalea longa]|uniref:Uncharacterized protein n=1 Tax=Vallitalea longa TaxID=2936439 RepID=A0A9W6DGF8_9FIRM|nr:hypothetical protein SH1V18_40700 [Vallitalea longa]
MPFIYFLILFIFICLLTLLILNHILSKGIDTPLHNILIILTQIIILLAIIIMKTHSETLSLLCGFIISFIIFIGIVLTKGINQNNKY